MNPIRRWKDRLAQTLRCLAVVLPMATAAAQAPAFLTNGLVAYYPFNGNYKDSSGKNNHAELGNPAKTILFENDRFGQDSCLRFIGDNSYLEVPSLIGFGPNQNRNITISIWVNSGAKGSFIGSYFHMNPDQSSFFLSRNQKDELIVAGNGFNVLYSAIPIVGWTHLALTFVFNGQDSDAALYANGVQIVSGRISRNSGNPTTKLTIGRVYGDDFESAYVQGSIDDVRIYNRALSESEVKALYEYEKIPQPASPRTASATAQVVNGFVVGATVVDGGGGYTHAPAVTISGGGGNGATAVATVTEGRVTGITIKTPGSGYTAMPSIVIAPPPFPPRRAQGASQVVNGFVVGATVSDAGFGYDSPPVVTLIGGGGSGASATATVANGVVTGIVITQPGSGYTSAPTLRIASPPFSPKLGISVSRVKVALDVVLGRKYQLESSSDLTAWKPTGPAFIAEDEQLEQEFEVATTGRYFRIQQVP